MQRGTRAAKRGYVLQIRSNEHELGDPRFASERRKCGHGCDSEKKYLGYKKPTTKTTTPARGTIGPILKERHAFRRPEGEELILSDEEGGEEDTTATTINYNTQRFLHAG